MALNQRRLLPSISMLSAFGAAARLGSFSRAASELNLTQGAISRQIRALEEQLGVELFERTPQHVLLSSAGAQYAKEVTLALNLLRTSTLNLMTHSDRGDLRLAILPTFGAKWLIPKLASFIEQNPDINITFKSHLEQFDFAEEEIDAAIHYGQADWPNAQCTFLMHETVVPVFSPAFEEKYKISTLEDFKDLPLLHLTTRNDHWAKWFKLNAMTCDGAQGIRFEQFSAVAQAACAGLGAALMPKLFVDNELNSGTLKAFDRGACKSSSAYYLVTPQHRGNYRPVVQFREWLIETSQGHYLS